MKNIQIILAKPMGFCAGVRRAVEILELAIAENKNRDPIYALHEIVHNKSVVDYFVEKGVIFVNDIEVIPDGSIAVFSAHGVAMSIKTAAKRKNLRLIDATCPLVTKVHNEIKKFASTGMDIVVIGDKNHPEVTGTVGQVDKDKVSIVYSETEIEDLDIESDKVAYVTQTTISMAKATDLSTKLKEKFPQITEPSTNHICYATQNRQNSVIQMANMVDVLIVIGSPNSSNSNQLKKIGILMGIKKSFLVNSKQEIDLNWFHGVHTVGITAGASAPDSLLQEIILHLQTILQATVITMDGVDENITFKIDEKKLRLTVNNLAN